MTLYDVTKEGLELEEILTASGGELTPEIEARLDALLAGGKDKLNAAACVVRNLEASAEMCAAESRRLGERKASFERNAAVLKARMLAAVDGAFGGTVKLPLFTIWGQNSAATISFDFAADANPQEMDQRFVRTSFALDKQLLKEQHKVGGAIPSGVAVTENEPTRYLRIR